MSRSSEARLFGVLGDPVDHSLSPAMHNAAFAAAHLPYLYLRFRVPPGGLAAAIREARRLRMGGLNLTVPLKEIALPLMDDLTREAARIGAVNTIVLRRGRLIGHNTDAAGFLAALGGRSLRGQHVVLVGAGGSARAVGVALVDAGSARITIANRTPRRAETLAARLVGLGVREISIAPLEALATGEFLADATLVVNTTPVGLFGDALRLRTAATPVDCRFVDLVYGSRPTPFLRAAARAHRETLDGARMLLHQGALAFQAWTNRPAPLGAMARALTAAGLTLTQRGRAASVPRRRPSIP